jgi:soluble lytic murein transglycosylase
LSAKKNTKKNAKKSPRKGPKKNTRKGAPGKSPAGASRATRLVVTRRGVIVLGAVACLIIGIVGFFVGRSSGAPPGAQPYRDVVAAWAREYNVDPHLTAAVIEAESSGRPRAVSSAGALGLMQLMPATAEGIARELGVENPSREDLFDPDVNIRFGVYYLSKLRARFGDERELVIAAYHAGPTRVDAWRTSRADLASADVVRELAFPQTRRYVERVMSLWKHKAAEARRSR